MINTSRMPDPPTRPAGATISPDIPQPHRPVPTPVEQDIPIEPIHRQHLGATVFIRVLGFKSLQTIRGPGRLGFGHNDGTVGRGDGEVGSWGVGPGRGGPEGGVRGGADQGGDVAGVGGRIVILSGRGICRGALAVCVPFFRVDEFG